MSEKTEGIVRVIDGKRYDTSKGKLVHTYQYLYPGDHGYRLERLYRTFKGNYFVYGKGGPASKWSYTEGNMSSGSSGIEPINKPEALEWCESHEAPANVMDQYFSDIIQDA